MLERLKRWWARFQVQVTRCAACELRGHNCIGLCGPDAVLRQGLDPDTVCEGCVSYVRSGRTFMGLLPLHHSTAEDCIRWRRGNVIGYDVAERAS